MEKRKIYELIDDKNANNIYLIRIIDESGEDYLYPKDFFAEIKLPVHLKEVVLAA